MAVLTLSSMNGVEGWGARGEGVLPGEPPFIFLAWLHPTL